MSQAKPILESFLQQTNVAANLINSLGYASHFSQQGKTQTSIENAIQTLLAPLQPAVDEPAKVAGEAVTVGNSQASNGKSFSGLTWAAGLIRQLPLDHDGRNSWLLNYGTDEDKEDVKNRTVNGQSSSTEAPNPSLDPNWCEECQVVHSGMTDFTGLVGLLDTLAYLSSKRKPPAA